MKTYRLSFLIFTALITGLISCMDENNKTQHTKARNNYTHTLIQQADSLKKANLTAKALIVNKRALQLSPSEQTDSLYARILKQRILLLGKLQLLDSVFIYTDKLLSISIKTKDTSSIAYTKYLKAFYFKKNHQVDSAIGNYYQSVQIYKQLDDSLLMVKRSYELVKILNDAANYEEAEKIAIDALQHLKKETQDNNYMRLINYLAIISKNKGQYKESLYWYDKVLDISKDPVEKISVVNNKAVVYLKQKEYRKALETLSRIVNNPLLDSPKYIVLKARIKDNSAYAKSKLGHRDAEKQLLEALKLRRQKNIPANLNASYIHLAEHYADRNDPRAVEMARQAYKNATSYKNADDRLDALAILIATSNAPRKYALQYHNISDSIYKAREQTQNSYAKIKFDAVQNRQENKLLKANAQLQASEISRIKIRNISLLLLLIVLGGGVVWRYRVIQGKHQRDRERATEETERIISKKIHDEVANDVFNTLMLVQNEVKTSPFLEKFEMHLDKLYNKTRNISREYGDIDTGQNFPAELKDMLASFHGKNVNVMIRNINSIAWKQINEIKKKVLYRTTQELMVNMKKHSGASIVVLIFKNESNKIIVQYSDNGTGFDSGYIQKGNGLLNVENRIEAINGNITFDKTSNAGCIITITIPQ